MTDPIRRIGTSGWSYPQWKPGFYPPGSPAGSWLGIHAATFPTVELNTSYHHLPAPGRLARWRAEVPADHRFAVKAWRQITHDKRLRDVGPELALQDAALAALGEGCGPVLFQLPPSLAASRSLLTAFLDLLPQKQDGLALRHCLEVRHPSFADPRFIAMCRDRGMAICVADHETFPLIPDVTADFVYLRLMTGKDEIPTAYAPQELDAWVERMRTYAAGEVPADFKPVDRTSPPAGPREVFAFVIHEGKVRAPAGAMAIIERAKA